MPQQVMNKEQLCKFIGISRSTLDALRKQGLPWYRLGKSVRFNLEAVLEWLKEQEVREISSQHSEDSSV